MDDRDEWDAPDTRWVKQMVINPEKVLKMKSFNRYSCILRSSIIAQVSLNDPNLLRKHRIL